MEPTYENVMMHMPDGMVVAGKLYQCLQRNDGYMYIVGDDSTLYVVPGGNVMNEAQPDKQKLLREIGGYIENMYNAVLGFTLLEQAGVLPMMNTQMGSADYSVTLDRSDFLDDDDDLSELDIIQLLISLFKMNSGPVSFLHTENGMADVLTVTIYHDQDGFTTDLGE